MIKVISSEKVPIKLWLNELEDQALEQAKNLANLPFVFRHVSLMPDAHSGYGMPIGGVLATQGVIIPNAVGKDIGCGMCALQTDINAEVLTQKKLRNLLREIRELIPVGFSHQKFIQDERTMPMGHKIKDLHIIKKEYEAALKQIGTLGGGNHFIELQKDEDNRVWVMIHSGSRNLGSKVADHYNNLAKKLNAKWASQVAPKADLAYLPFETEEAQDYFHEMRYCVDFALANRSLMMQRIQAVLDTNFEKVVYEPMLNKAHNYANMEEHFGHKVIVHRKGATSAKLGETGIIPGSQGTHSYIVEGLGNAESFESCSHGAGRLMSRSKAVKSLNLKEEIRRLDEKGIVHALRTQQDLEEAPSSYKDIVEVMANQTDLVKIMHTLSPLGVIKV